MERCSTTLLTFILGLWLGGSIVVWAAATYNFAGIEHMFERNPALAERAGFSPEDENSMKSSLIWVHSSELNRVLFEYWGYGQLALGLAALILALGGRQGGTMALLLLIALGLASYSTLKLTPEIVALGRTLDFLPRDPKPPQLTEFGQLHGVSLLVDLVRGVVLIVCTGVAVVRCRGQRSEVRA